MDKSITAEWARRTTEKVLGDKAGEQITKCENEIKTAVSSNKFSCTIGFMLEDIAIKELEKRGFHLTKHQPEYPMETSYYEITW